MLFLIEHKIIVIDEKKSKKIFYRCLNKGSKYYFYPEIKNFLNDQEFEDIKQEITEADSEIFSNFENCC